MVLHFPPLSLSLSHQERSEGGGGRREGREGEGRTGQKREVEGR